MLKFWAEVVVRVFAFYSDDPSSNPVEHQQFFLQNLFLERTFKKRVYVELNTCYRSHRRGYSLLKPYVIFLSVWNVKLSAGFEPCILLGKIVMLPFQSSYKINLLFWKLGFQFFAPFYNEAAWIPGNIAGNGPTWRKIQTSAIFSVTRLGDLLDFGLVFKAFGNNKFVQISHILRQFFV